MTQTHHTLCSLCEATCGIVVETDGARVVSIRGDEADAFSRGYLCPKAVALQDLYDDPDRLRAPVRRRGDGWEPIGWDEAFDEVAAGIRTVQERHGRDALAIYQGNPTVHSLGALTYGQLFMQRVKTRNRYSATSTDQLPHMLASLWMFGHQLLFCVPDVDRTAFFLILGGNPVVSNGSIMTAPDVKRRIEDVRARGGKVVVVDPRRTETAAIADRHMFIRPGTDALFLAALIEAVFAEGREDLGRLAPYIDGLGALRTAVRRFPAEEVAGTVGIAAADIRALARELAAADSAVCYGRVGVCQQEFGGLAAWLVNALNVVTGNLDEPGGAMFARPGFDLAGVAARIGQRGHYGVWRSRVRGLPEFGGELPAATLADEIATEGEGRVRALLVSAGNPVLSLPNGAALERALPELDFMVAIDPYINETTRHAHVILPPTTPLERDHYDVAFGLLKIRQHERFGPAVFARGPDQRHDWEIFLALWARLDPARGVIGRAIVSGINALGAKLGPRAWVDLALRTGPHKLRLRDLLDKPSGIDLGPLVPRLPELLVDGKIHLAPEPYLADLDRLARRAPGLAAQRLVLIGRRHLRSNNSWMHNSHRLVKGKPRCTLLVHPTDASARGLRDGDTVRVTSRAGSIAVPVEISDEVMRGVVSLPHGWGHARPGVKLTIAREHAGASANDLTDDQVIDTLSGNAVYNGVPVEVTRA
jgi:anaerobic selenocysteine-containing dehydrogenase